MQTVPRWFMLHAARCNSSRSRSSPKRPASWPCCGEGRGPWTIEAAVGYCSPASRWA